MDENKPIIFGYDSKRGYENVQRVTSIIPNKNCIYPHNELLYILDAEIIQKNIRKINTNPHISYERKTPSNMRSMDPKEEITSKYNQKILGKYDIKSGNYNNQRELRGIVKDEKMSKTMDKNIMNFSYGRF